MRAENLLSPTPELAHLLPFPSSYALIADRLARPRLTTALLVMTDALALVLSGVSSCLVRSLITGSPLLLEDTLPFWPLVPLTLLIYATKGLYPGVALNPALILKRLTLATSQMYLTTTVVLFLLRSTDDFSRSVFLISWILSLLLVPLGRAVIEATCSRRWWWGHAAVILAEGSQAEALMQILQQHSSLGLKPIATLNPCPQPSPVPSADPPTAYASLPLLRDRDPWQPTDIQKIPYAILPTPGIPSDQLATIIQTYGQRFQHLLLIPDLAGFSSLWVETKDLSGVMGLEIKQELLNPRSQLIKHVIDKLGAGLGILITLPFLLIIAVLVQLESPGSFIYAQERLGKHGSTFKAFKFRSMYQDAEQRLQDILNQDPEARQQYETYHKLPQDPRVTRIGHVLRRYSLDELPQLWNVLRGEMSLVGPRAYMSREIPDMQGKEQIILQVTPALTGLWQVSGRNSLTFEQRLNLDIYYVRNWSIWMDLYILARTVWVVISGHGSPR
ncbi:MAG: undecaprenyl-phosphate galactose phosphotransferase WbaP [Cyanobacteriota bacterium]|nr:undecaprenyl-phosphate galactose phosphotransferase WbaP [Cyanobacteriota bacterium]